MLDRMVMRVATDAERARYQDVVYPVQDRLLRSVASYGDAVVLMGDAALTRFVFQHRLSDDLDLFVAGESVRDIANELSAVYSRQGLTVDVERAGEYHVRMYVADGSTRMKMDIVVDQPRIEAPVRAPNGTWMHALADIAANKVSAYEDRREWKDLVDLYYLAKRFSWAEMFAGAERKRVPIAYDEFLKIASPPPQGEAFLLVPLDGHELLAFAQDIQQQTAAELKKKATEWSARIPAIVADALWDYPAERRVLNRETAPILERRARDLSLPRELALRAALEAARNS